jgi:hypothetical protein
LPLYHRDFLAGLEAGQLARLVARCEELAVGAPPGVPQLGCDLFLAEAYARLDRADFAQQAAARVAANACRKQIFTGDVAAMVETLRAVRLFWSVAAQPGEVAAVSVGAADGAAPTTNP